MGKWNGPPREQWPLCGAKTRAGTPCKRHARANGRCRLHGGLSTGAKNPHRPLKHGRRTKEAMEERRQLAKLLKDARDLLHDMEST